MGSEYIGKRVLVNIGHDYDRSLTPSPITEEALVEKFTKDMKRFFRPEVVAEEITKEKEKI